MEVAGFRGIKQIYPEPKIMKKSVTVFWKKIFGYYLLPPCPICGEDLTLRELSIPGQMYSHYSHHRYLPKRIIPDELALTFKCEKCNVRVSGFGLALKFDHSTNPVGFTIEYFGIKEIKYPAWWKPNERRN